MTALERQIATYERDSGKVLDDEIKIGTFLLRLPESQLKTRLLMRVDILKSGLISGVKLSRFREQFLLLSRNRPQWTLELWERDSLVRMAREQKVVENATIKHSMHVRDVETRSTRPQIVPTLIKRAKNVERSVIWQVRADQLDRNNPSQKVTASRARVTKVRVLPKRAGIVVKVDTCRHNARRKRCTQWMSRQRQ